MAGILIRFSALVTASRFFLSFFFFNDTATTEIYTLSLHDALPISLEVIGPEAERDAPPVIRASTEHAATPPAKVRAGRRRIRLPLDVPAAVAGIEFAKRAIPVRGAAPR